MKVEHSLPQGSVFGPLSFLPNVNVITENAQGAKLVLFSDDTNLLITGKVEFAVQYKIVNIMKKHLLCHFIKNK
jgi:hypothetical protein